MFKQTLRQNTKTMASMLFVVLAMASCGRAPARVTLSAADDARAQELCLSIGTTAAKDYGRIDGLARSFPTDVAGMRSWERTRSGPDGPVPDPPPRAKSDNAFLAVCYFDGTFGGFPQPPPPPGVDDAPRPYDRLLLAVADDATVTVVAVGPRAKMDTSSGPPPPKAGG